MGVLPGVMGLYQANEVIKIILGLGKILSGTLFTLNLLNLDQKQFTFRRDEKEVELIKKDPLHPSKINDCNLDLNGK